MCDLSEKVVAWLDGELPTEMAAELERHVGTCFECGRRMNACKKISAALTAYCEVKASASPRRILPVKSLAIATAAVAVLAIFLVRPHHRAVQPAFLPATATTPAVVVPRSTREPIPEAAAVPIKQVRRRHPAPLAQTPSPQTQLTQNIPGVRPSDTPAVQIAIPAESLFLPGAAPQGVVFVADLSLPLDNSAQLARLQPKFIELERSR